MHEDAEFELDVIAYSEPLKLIPHCMHAEDLDRAIVVMLRNNEIQLIKGSKKMQGSGRDIAKDEMTQKLQSNTN